jgi:hypothetical protein
MFSLGRLSAGNVTSLIFDQEYTPRDRRIPLDTKNIVKKALNVKEIQLFQI